MRNTQAATEPRVLPGYNYTPLYAQALIRSLPPRMCTTPQPRARSQFPFPFACHEQPFQTTSTRRYLAPSVISV